ncbi:hypothetical protein H4R35_004033, partial [Dimargaris xerosporica]
MSEPTETPQAATTTLSAEDQELEAMRQRVQQMEEEAAKLRQMHEEVEKKMGQPDQEKNEADLRSVYVGNVDYAVTPEELQKHFESSGMINRVTILCDKFTGHPKGYAFIEFAEQDSVKSALAQNESLLHGRPLKVTEKRANIP